MLLKKTDRYLLLVDDTLPIKYGSYFLLGGRHVNRYVGRAAERYRTDLSVRIVAYYPLDILASMIDVPMLPDPFASRLEDGINDFINEYQQNGMLPGHARERIMSLIDIAKDDRYGVDHIREAFRAGAEFGIDGYRCNAKNWPDEDKYIMSLLNEREFPTEFIVETCEVDDKEAWVFDFKMVDGVMKQVLVGSYKFE